MLKAPSPADVGPRIDAPAGRRSMVRWVCASASARARASSCSPPAPAQAAKCRLRLPPAAVRKLQPEVRGAAVRDRALESAFERGGALQIVHDDRGREERADVPMPTVRGHPGSFFRHQRKLPEARRGRSALAARFGKCLLFGGADRPVMVGVGLIEHREPGLAVFIEGDLAVLVRVELATIVRAVGRGLDAGGAAAMNSALLSWPSLLVSSLVNSPSSALRGGSWRCWSSPLAAAELAALEGPSPLVSTALKFASRFLIRNSVRVVTGAWAGRGRLGRPRTGAGGRAAVATRREANAREHENCGLDHDS